jgi:hypothetical protein
VYTTKEDTVPTAAPRVHPHFLTLPLRDRVALLYPSVPGASALAGETFPPPLDQVCACIIAQGIRPWALRVLRVCDLYLVVERAVQTAVNLSPSEMTKMIAPVWSEWNEDCRTCRQLGWTLSERRVSGDGHVVERHETCLDCGGDGYVRRDGVRL